MHIEVYSDGSATTNDKPGGYGWALVLDGKLHSVGSGYMEKASNNDAELEAAVKGLQAAFNLYQEIQVTTPIPDIIIYGADSPIPPVVTLVSDSQLVLGWANGSYRFRQENKLDRFKALQILVNLMAVSTRWVEGHTGEEFNELCDKLANDARLVNSPKTDIVEKQPLRRIWVDSERIPSNGIGFDTYVCSQKQEGCVEFVEVRRKKK